MCKDIPPKRYRIAVAGMGYVGLSVAILLAQHHHVIAIDLLSEKIRQINCRQSPIRDPDMERYLSRPYAGFDRYATTEGSLSKRRLCGGGHTYRL